MFSNIVLKILKNPKNAGRISKPDGIADCYNEDKTAHVEFSLRIESGIITNCQFRAQANPYYIAICSTIANMVKGKMVSMVFLDPYSIKKELGDESRYNIDFCIDCLRFAVADYKEKLEKENKDKSKKGQEIVVQTETGEEIKEESIELAEEQQSKPIEEVLINQTQEINLNISNEDDDDDFSDFFDFLDD